jgi:hypothetical protein
MSFENSCKAVTVLFAVLFVLLLATPEFIFWLFSVPQSQTANLIARRAAMLFLGFAVISWSARNAPDSPLRRGYSLGIVVSMVGLASTGTYEFLRGFANWPIMLAAATECAFALIFLRYTWRSK